MQTSNQSSHEVTLGTAKHCVEDNSQISIKHRNMLPASTNRALLYLNRVRTNLLLRQTVVCLHCWWQANLYCPCMHAICSQWHTAHLISDMQWYVLMNEVWHWGSKSNRGWWNQAYKELSWTQLAACTLHRLYTVYVCIVPCIQYASCYACKLLSCRLQLL